MEAAKNNQPTSVKLLLDAGASTFGIVEYGSGEYIGKTFFDFAQENPNVQHVYDTYRKEFDELISERFLHIHDLAQIVAAFIFTPVPIK